MKKTLSMILATMLVLSAMGMILANMPAVGEGTQVSSASEPPIKPSYTPHAPIRINGDADFLGNTSGGNGSAGNPWVIENYDIDGTGVGYCIYIGNTTDYFVVRDCYLHHASGNSGAYFWDAGLALSNTQNGSMTNNAASVNTYGIYLDASNSNNIANNTASSNTWEGIYLQSSNGNTLANNIVSSNAESGISLYSSNSNTITNNTASNNGEGGIYLYQSSSNTIANNTAPFNHWASIYLSSSSGNIIANNNASSSFYGINLINSDSNTIANNTASSNDFSGIYIESSGGNTITNNTASSNDGNDIFLFISWSNTLANNTMVGEGIYVFGSVLGDWSTHGIDTSNTVNGKPVQYWKNEIGGTVPPGAGQVILANCTNVYVMGQNINHANYGISLGFCDYNFIDSNIASSNDYAIDLYNSNGNTIANNTVSSSKFCGINLDTSDSNIIVNNTALDSTTGISLGYSDSNHIVNNTVSNNSNGISLGYSNSNYITNNIASNNGVDGISAGSSNTIVNNTALNNGVDGISAGGNNIIANNTASNNGVNGISAGNNNTIANNTANFNSNSGIYLVFSGNIITNNTVSGNQGSGINFYSWSNNNTIANNTAFGNQYGIYLSSSNHDNTFYHNNFIANTNQAYDDGINFWNNSYPSGGNYWSDYTGTDAMSGPGQNIPGADGIGDTPYTNIGGMGVQDNYPLMNATVPVVDSTVPLNAAVGVAIGQNIVMTFNREMNPATFIYNVAPNPGGLSIAWSAGNTVATIMHTAFAYNTTYWVNITTATDIAGNLLVPMPYSFSFTILEEATATATGPTGGPSNVAAITLAYTWTGTPTSVNLHYTTNNGTTWALAGNDATVDGSYAFTLTVSGTYGWLASAVGGGSVELSPPTGGTTPEATSYIFDNVRPTVISTVPLGAAVGVLTDTDIVITYSEPMNISAGNGSVTPNPGGLTRVWSGDNTILTITHNTLVPNTKYWVNSTGRTDIAGNALDPASYSFSFTTENIAGATATGPTNLAPSNMAEITIAYTFTGTPTSVNLYYTTNDGTTWTFAGNDDTVDGSYALTLTVASTYGWIAQAVDGGTVEPSPPADGTTPEATSYIFDNVAPTVVLTVPLNAAVGVPIDTDIVITYSEPMNILVGNGSVTPNPGGLARVWSDGNTTLTITHAPLAFNTTYWVNSTGRVDMAGNALNPPSFSFSFTTVRAASTSTDSDGDGVPDDQDAFPDDPAASVDTDDDGMPDEWNEGYTAEDSTTGLVEDDDDDDDGIPDSEDDDPLNPNDAQSDIDMLWIILIIIIVVVALAVIIGLKVKRGGKKQDAPQQASQQPIQGPQPGYEQQLPPPPPGWSPPPPPPSDD